MFALGQKQTYAVQKAMSALPPKADMCGALAHVCFVPIADIRKTRQIAVTQWRVRTRCRISTCVWPFGKCLRLRILRLRNSIGAPNFVGSPETAVRLGHQSAFFRLIECRSRAGIYLPTPIPEFENIFHAALFSWSKSYELCGTSICVIRKTHNLSICQVSDATGVLI